MSEKVTVVLRIRPLLQHEAQDAPCVTSLDSKTVCVGDRRLFTVDHIFDSPSGTEALYETYVRQLVSAFLGGFNGSILAYGQTGAGKSYTVDGLTPLVLKQILSGVPPQELSFGFIEVYGEVLHDLLAVDGDVHKALQLVDGGDGSGTHVIGASRVRVRSFDEAMRVVDHGKSMRATAATGMNATSSRSHSILSIYHQRLQSKLHLVDLAGSERNKRTHNVGIRFKESVGINTGLLALGNVIRALSKPPQHTCHVPYRSSKLTRLLQDSLGGNSKTVFVACIAPNTSNRDESTRTLQYCHRTMLISNEPIPAVDVQRAAQQRNLLRLERNSLSGRQHALIDEFAEEQAAEIVRLNKHVSDLVEELRNCKELLHKDEQVFAKQLLDQRTVRSENKELKSRLDILEKLQQEKCLSTRILSAPSQFKNPPSSLIPGRSVRKASPSPLSDVNGISPSPQNALRLQTEKIVSQLEDSDQVCSPWAVTVSPPLRTETNVKLFLSYETSPVVSAIFPTAIQTTWEKGTGQQDDKDILREIMHQNNRLREDNLSLRNELFQIGQMLT